MSTDEDDKKDPKVKALVERRPDEPLERFVDAQTAAQLERWFGLPSFAEVEAKNIKVVEEDPGVVAVRRRRQKIVDEEIDRALLASIERRLTPPESKFTPNIEPFDPTMALFDASSIQRIEVSEPAEYAFPEDIEDLLKENTPQALLRDLHRPEYDPSAPSDEMINPDFDEPPPPPFDLAATIETAMTTKFRAEPIELPEMATLMDESRNEIRVHRWSALPTRVRMVNRRVTE